MTQYIPKDALVAEIKKIYNENYKFLPSDLVESVGDFKDDLLIALDTIETKEVDLEKEVIDWWNTYYSNIDYTFEEYNGHYLKNSTIINIAKHFYELGMKLNNIQPKNVIEIKWKPCTEIPTEHWENNPAISPLYLVKCGSVNGNAILGYTHYSYASNSWMDCFHATEDGVWKVLEWADKNI